MRIVIVLNVMRQVTKKNVGSVESIRGRGEGAFSTKKDLVCN
jgi:hypothetical protein